MQGLSGHGHRSLSLQNVLARTDSTVLVPLLYVSLRWSYFHHIGRAILQNGSELFERQDLFL